MRTGAFAAPNAKSVPKLFKWRSFWTENKTLWDHEKRDIQRQSPNSWKDTKEPPPQPKLTVPLKGPHYLNIIGQCSPSPKQCAIGEMAIIAFYYLLCAGKYTIQDIALWNGTK